MSTLEKLQKLEDAITDAIIAYNELCYNETFEALDGDSVDEMINIFSLIANFNQGNYTPDEYKNGLMATGYDWWRCV